MCCVNGKSFEKISDGLYNLYDASDDYYRGNTAVQILNNEGF